MREDLKGANYDDYDDDYDDVEIQMICPICRENNLVSIAENDYQFKAICYCGHLISIRKIKVRS